MCAFFSLSTGGHWTDKRWEFPNKLHRLLLCVEGTRGLFLALSGHDTKAGGSRPSSPLVLIPFHANTLYAENRDPGVAADSSRNGLTAFMVASGNSSCTAS